jgi:hypothetical protein
MDELYELCIFIFIVFPIILRGKCNAAFSWRIVCSSSKTLTVTNGILGLVAEHEKYILKFFSQERNVEIVMKIFSYVLPKSILKLQNQGTFFIISEKFLRTNLSCNPTILK